MKATLVSPIALSALSVYRFVAFYNTWMPKRVTFVCFFNYFGTSSLFICMLGFWNVIVYIKRQNKFNVFNWQFRFGNILSCSRPWDFMEPPPRICEYNFHPLYYDLACTYEIKSHHHMISWVLYSFGGWSTLTSNWRMFAAMNFNGCCTMVIFNNAIMIFTRV